MVGTRLVTVTPCASMRSKAARASKRGRRTWAAPAAVAVQIAQASARWNIGAAWSQASSARNLSSRSVMSTCAARLRSVSTTPFGRPVVPLV
jgi:hypothetical protein